MALQADLPPLDFSVIEEKKTVYIAAVQAGMDEVTDLFTAESRKSDFFRYGFV